MSRRHRASGEEYARLVKQQAQEERSRGYFQPLEASWREFLKERGWTPSQVDELPDDWLYAEWGMYILRNRYKIGQ